MKFYPPELEIIPDNNSSDHSHEIYERNEIFPQNGKGKKQIDEVKFIEAFIKTNNLVNINGRFCNFDGIVSDIQVKQDIYRTLSEEFSDNLAQKTDSLFKGLIYCAHKNKTIFSSTEIPILNGTLKVSSDKIIIFEKKNHSPYRLSVTLPLKDGQLDCIPTPNFDKWITDLLYEEDIPLAQEMLGYFLLPTTKAQKCFIFIGKGGEGKSIWGDILQAMLGNAYGQRDIVDLEKNRFAMADLENKLVCYIDDLSKKSLVCTEQFKRLITATSLVTAERKFGDSFQFIPYARLIATSNYMLTSANDHSEGFYRRIIPILTKPRSADRENIAGFGEKIVDEINGIFVWALAGLQRLVQNGFKFSVGERSEAALQESRNDAENILKFVNDDLLFDSELSMTHKNLYAAYAKWCMDNAEYKVDAVQFRTFFKENAEKWKLRYSENITQGGVRGRGYKGVGLKTNRGIVILTTGGNKNA